MSVQFMGDGWLSAERPPQPHGADLPAYQRDLEIARLAEPLGFDSVWTVEHHFTGYSMVPNPLQFLTYLAGQTTRVRLGTMVLVVPWHQPARLAGEIAMLDNISGGRFVLGLGRGLGRMEFEGLGVPMSDSREIFVESTQAILEGLERGYLKHEGPHVSIPRVSVRPSATRTFRGRTYASAVSPESFETMARLGLGLLIVPQKPWPTVIADVAGYREVFERINGREAPAPIVVNYVFCDEDRDRAHELGRIHIGEYYRSCVVHYELGGAHFADQQGYGYYEQNSAYLNKRGTSKVELDYADLQSYGTPAECVERAAYIRESVGACELLANFSYSGLPLAECARNARLYAETVVPEIKKMTPKRTGALVA